MAIIVKDLVALRIHHNVVGVLWFGRKMRDPEIERMLTEGRLDLDIGRWSLGDGVWHPINSAAWNIDISQLPNGALVGIYTRDRKPNVWIVRDIDLLRGAVMVGPIIVGGLR